MVEVLNKRSVKRARKIYNCSYCSSPINIGDSYEYARMKYGMEYYEVKAHVYCHAVAHELMSSGYFTDDGFGMTQVDFKFFIKRLHESFCAYQIFNTDNTMARDLANIFKTKKLESHCIYGGKEWILKYREETK